MSSVEFRDWDFSDYLWDFRSTETSFVSGYVIPFGTIIAYMLFIFVGKNFFTYKEKNFDTISYYWNWFLCIWSWIMHICSAIPFWYRVSQIGFLAIITDDIYAVYILKSSTPTFLVIMYKFAVINFVYSKFAELFDTVLLIMKKPDRQFMKMPLFLHWFHHVTVLVFTYYCLYFWFPPGQLFLLMNSTVHGFMYYYYAVTSIGARPKWGKLLTMGQTIQMFFGIGIIFIWGYKYIFYDEPQACHRPIFMAVYCTLMYGSYLYMFIQFFIMKYMTPKKNKTKKTE